MAEQDGRIFNLNSAAIIRYLTGMAAGCFHFWRKTARFHARAIPPTAGQNMTVMGKILPRLAMPLLAGLLLASHAEAADKTIRMVPRGDLNILDPVWSTVAITRDYGYMVYDTLFSPDANFKPQPEMVDKFDVSADGLTYSFTLRPGLKWHDGAPVTAADCVASVQRWSKRNLIGQKMAEKMDKIEATGDNSFVIKMKAKFDVLSALAEPSSSPAFMMPARIAATDANTQIKETIGSGPFIFKKDEWVPGNKEVFVKNPNYIPRKEPASFLAGGKVVKVDRVEWIHIPDANTILAALISGEVDYYQNPSLDFLPTIEKNKQIVLLDLDKLGSQATLRLNHLQPPFNNVKARQAVLYAIDQQEYMQAVAGDAKYYWKDCYALFACGGPYESDIGAIKKPDLAKAKALLKESGYNGEKVVVLDPTNVPVLHAAVTVTVNNLRKLGMNVDVQAMDIGTMIARRAKKDAPDAGGWNVFHTQFQGTEQANPPGNAYIAAPCEKGPPGWPCDQTIEDLRNAFLAETDPAKRKEIANKLQARAYEFVPYISVGQLRQPIAYRSNLKGVLQSGATVFWNIEKD
jgi:peptide/nickel transport system substrate-binding protein